MRRMLLFGFAAVLCAAFAAAKPAAARELSTSIDLDYLYSQADIGGDINAATAYNQKYEIKYETSLTTAHDFLGAVRLTLLDGWYTNQASTSQVSPTLELSTKGSQLAAKIAYEAVISSIDAYREANDVKSYSTSLSFDLEMTPVHWPEVKLKFQRRGDYQDYSKESTSSNFEFSTRKDIYALRLEYLFSRSDTDNVLPARTGTTATKWSAKATYKEILWAGTEFELAYEINESYEDQETRGIFTGETSNYNQVLRTRLKNSLDIAPRMALSLSWEYQFEQDLLALEFDYKLKNSYVLDMRWDAFDSLKFTGEARRETDLSAAVVGVEDDRTLTDGLKAAFELTSISWLQLSGKADFKNTGTKAADTGGSVDQDREEKYELIARNRIGESWDLTVDATATNLFTNGWRTSRETKVKTDLKFKLLDVAVTPSYEVSRKNDWLPDFETLTGQQQIRDAKIRFEYQLQLVEMFKATFSHEYGFKIEDKLDDVLNFDRVLQFSEGTRLSIVLVEIVRDVKVEGEIERKGSDSEGDTDPQLVELSYALKLDWKYRGLSVLSSFKYNDKGDTFDDLSVSLKAGWKGEHLDVSGEYQYDKIIKDITEPKDEKRKLNVKLSYKF